MNFLKLILKISMAFFIIFCGNKIFAQEKSNVNLEISKMFERSFFNRYLFDIGTGYNTKKNKFYIGGSLNITYSKLKYSGNDTKTFIIKPRINISYPINLGDRINFEPKFGLGYSIIYMNSKKYDFTDYQQGINTLLELKFNYITKTKVDYYFITNYDYIYLKKNESFTKLNYYSNIHLINFGIGAKLKFYNDEN